MQVEATAELFGVEAVHLPGLAHNMMLVRYPVAVSLVSHGAGAHLWPWVHCWEPCAMQCARVSALMVLLQGIQYAAGH